MQMEYRWRVIIPLTACYDIVVSEDRSDSITPIPTVRFKVREAPQSVDASEKPANRIDPTLITAEKSLEEVSTNVDANPEVGGSAAPLCFREGFLNWEARRQIFTLVKSTTSENWYYRKK